MTLARAVSVECWRQKPDWRRRVNGEHERSEIVGRSTLGETNFKEALTGWEVE